MAAKLPCESWVVWTSVPSTQLIEIMGDRTIPGYTPRLEADVVSSFDNRDDAELTVRAVADAALEQYPGSQKQESYEEPGHRLMFTITRGGEAIWLVQIRHDDGRANSVPTIDWIFDGPTA